MATLRVDVWSDIACPWCWVGKRNLERAAKELAAADFGHELEVVWHAFELDPAAPREVADDVDLVARLAAKYGTSRDGAQQMIDRMTRVGADAGIDFHFDRVRPTNTFDAHRLMEHAAAQGKQDALGERLFVAYMQEGRDVADHETLVSLAEEVGLDADAVQAVLSSDDFAKDVRRDEGMAAQLGVTGVPFFAVDGRFAVPGAQPPEVLQQVLRKAADSLAEEPPGETAQAQAPAADEADVCGPDGCAVPSRAG